MTRGARRRTLGAVALAVAAASACGTAGPPTAAGAGPDGGAGSRTTTLAGGPPTAGRPGGPPTDPSAPACSPRTPGTPDAAGTTPERLTTTAATAAHLLRANGAAAGPQVVTGTQLSFEEAFEIAAVRPGDVAVVEREWLRQAVRDGVFDGATSLEAQVRHLGATTVTDADLVEHLGPAWRAVLDTLGSVTDLGFDGLVDRVRASPPMRSTSALETRSGLREYAVTRGRGAQWDAAQEIVTVYFQRCTLDVLVRRATGVVVPGDDRGWELAEALTRDAVAAAVLSDLGGGVRSRTASLARGLRIALAQERPVPGESLSTAVDPNENVRPGDLELVEREEPAVDGG